MNSQDTLNQFVAKVFGNGSTPAQEANSIQLEIDVVPLPGETQEFALFKVLITILVEGINVLFGTGASTGRKINLSDITEEQMNSVNEYMRSFGWEVVLEKAARKKMFRINIKNIVTNKLLPNYAEINQNN